MTLCMYFILLFPFIQACPSGWIQHENQCYHFSHVTGSWAEAVGYCSVFGAKLAEPVTTSEINFLSGQVQNEGSGTDRYFLGGTDMFVEGEWLWATSGIQISQTNWAIGEPHNLNGHHEDCLSIYRINGLWDDVVCSAVLPFVCQIENMGPGQGTFGK